MGLFILMLLAFWIRIQGVERIPEGQFTESEQGVISTANSTGAGAVATAPARDGGADEQNLSVLKIFVNDRSELRVRIAVALTFFGAGCFYAG